MFWPKWLRRCWPRWVTDVELRAPTGQRIVGRVTRTVGVAAMRGVLRLCPSFGSSVLKLERDPNVLILFEWTIRVGLHWALWAPSFVFLFEIEKVRLGLSSKKQPRSATGLVQQRCHCLWWPLRKSLCTLAGQSEEALWWRVASRWFWVKAICSVVEIWCWEAKCEQHWPSTFTFSKGSMCAFFCQDKSHFKSPVLEDFEEGTTYSHCFSGACRLPSKKLVHL